MATELICCRAADWIGGPVDLVLTNPYDSLPSCLFGTPMILCQRLGREEIVSHWAGGADLTLIGRYGHDENHGVWAANMKIPRRMPDISMVGDEVWRNGAGWFPLDLPIRLIHWYATKVLELPGDGIAEHGLLVWDGFCGRGTVGAACDLIGIEAICLDHDPSRIALAERYLYDLGVAC